MASPWPAHGQMSPRPRRPYQNMSPHFHEGRALQFPFPMSAGLFAGPLIRRFSYRKVAFGGALLVAIGILATVPANSVTHIIATYSVLIGNWDWASWEPSQRGVGCCWSFPEHPLVGLLQA